MVIVGQLSARRIPATLHIKSERGKYKRKQYGGSCGCRNGLEVETRCSEHQKGIRKYDQELRYGTPRQSCPKTLCHLRCLIRQLSLRVARCGLPYPSIEKVAPNC